MPIFRGDVEPGILGTCTWQTGLEHPVKVREIITFPARRERIQSQASPFLFPLVMLPPVHGRFKNGPPFRFPPGLVPRAQLKLAIPIHLLAVCTQLSLTCVLFSLLMCAAHFMELGLRGGRPREAWVAGPTDVCKCFPTPLTSDEREHHCSYHHLHGEESFGSRPAMT